MDAWIGIGFTVEITGDQSPSLRLLSATYPDATHGESMHHSGGAAAETELIYGQVIHQGMRLMATPHCLSIGLGLGYVELTVAREALLQSNLDFSLESFELVPELKSYFISWLKGENQPAEVRAIYDQVLKFILKDHPELTDSVKALLLQKLNEKQWILQGPLLQPEQVSKAAHMILFDAFSAKTTPDLWNEEFLKKFFCQVTQPACLFSTYACRASLKRALKENGFAIVVREGFQGKRNSTLAFRGVTFPTFAAAEIS